MTNSFVTRSIVLCITILLCNTSHISAMRKQKKKNKKNQKKIDFRAILKSFKEDQKKKGGKKVKKQQKNKKKTKANKKIKKAAPKAKKSKLIPKKKPKLYDYLTFMKKQNKENIHLKKAYAAISKSKNIGIIHCIFNTKPPENPENKIFKKLKREYYGEDVLNGYFIEQAKTVKAFQRNIELDHGKIEHWFIITEKSSKDKSSNIIYGLERVFPVREWASEKNIPLKHVLFPQNSLCSLDPEIMSSAFNNLYKQVVNKLYKKVCLQKDIPKIPIFQSSDYT